MDRFGAKARGESGADVSAAAFLSIARGLTRRLAETRVLLWCRRHPVVSSLLAFVFLAFWWPYLRPWPDQDDCTFGPVSNAEYRAILAEAKKEAGWRWYYIGKNDLEPTILEMYRKLSNGAENLTLPPTFIQP